MTIDLTGHLKTCRRSHPHEEMDDVCERYTEYERELASLRAEKERAEAGRDAALKDAERYRFIRAGKSGTYNTILIHAGSQLDAAIDAARKGEQ